MAPHSNSTSGESPYAQQTRRRRRSYPLDDRAGDFASLSVSICADFERLDRTLRIYDLKNMLFQATGCITDCLESGCEIISIEELDALACVR